MAEENTAEKQSPAQTTKSGGPAQKPTLFIILAVFNMLVVAGVGTMIYMGKKAEEKKPGIEAVVNGEQKQLLEEAQKEDFIGQLVPLETFLVNLSGSRGRKLAKVNMELEVSGLEVQEEIEKLKPKIRDIIIIVLSSKTYTEVSSKEGKDTLRDEVRDQVNLFLTKGHIKRVYFTEFIYN